MTTHDLDEADKLADRIIILVGGRILAQGSTEELPAAAPPTRPPSSATSSPPTQKPSASSRSAGPRWKTPT
jgi:ABC-type multidrug transport system ATPase subunit